MDESIFQESLKLIEPIAHKFMNFVEPPTQPSQLSPFSYIGIGSFPIEHQSPQIDIFQFTPTLPTMTIEAKRDLITGEIISYENLSITTDDRDINRQVGTIDKYCLSSKSKTPLYTISKIPQKTINFTPFIESLDTGMNLLVDPFSNEVDSITDFQVDDPSLPLTIGPATDVPNPRANDENSSKIESSEFKAIIDDFDASQLCEKVPNMAIDFKFKLDEFQARSIYRLERKECVFVSAPTSAGKTVVAEYAIALCNKHKMRTIYTSPIKALSNQKYREFLVKFGEVGIITGDVSINTEASILIMTTEILRLMLYRGADILRDVECVIFDECHYIANEERGVVWEESIILMPPDINMVFLSATIPNYLELASWISRTKERPVYVEIRLDRPIPLSHSLYYSGKFYKVVDQAKKVNGKPLFNEEAINKAKVKFDKDKSFYGIKFNIQYQDDYWMTLFTALKKKNLLPALVYSFSIRNIEDYIKKMKGISFLTNEEKNHVTNFFYKNIRKLPEKDRNLPQINQMLDLLKCGIGFHHSGVLQILREIVEILLNDGFVKIIFCTSTVGMGINVPARTCVFSNFTIFNGKTFDYLTKTQFLQMSGRAGRRGLDDTGNTVICIGKEFPDRGYLRNFFIGTADKVASQFKITSSMILRSIRDNWFNISDILKRSLMANLTEKEIPKIKEKIEKLKEKLNELPKITDCPQPKSYESSNNDIEDIECGTPILSFVDDSLKLCEVNSEIVNGNTMAFLNALKEGMIVLLTTTEFVSIAIIERIHYQEDEIMSSMYVPSISFFIPNKPVYKINKYENLKEIHLLTSSVINDIQSLDPETKKSKISSFNYKEDLQPYNVFIKNKYVDFFEKSNLHQKLLLNIFTSPCFKCPSLSEHYKVSMTAHNIRKTIENNKESIESDRSQLIPTAKCFINMLKELNYISGHTDNYTLTLKGQVSLILSGEGITITEIFYNGLFNNCTPEEVIALASCLVARKAKGTKNNYDEEEENKEEDKEIINLEKIVNEMYEIAKYVERKMIENAVPFDDDTFLDLAINDLLLKPVFLWSKGEPFAEVMKYTNGILAGTFVNIIRDIQSLLAKFVKASKLLGLKTLSEKYQNASEIIKRDIIFTGSIYLD
ncbi:hypothetical protein M9Y10_007068 [Tritrichomonas musculus]|uniref:Uncharacterized protein n=1 Tax=Tritrichomonas musculus TaxID=1915356 RepID=A0ABR2J0B2_9EUKA